MESEQQKDLPEKEGSNEEDICRFEMLYFMKASLEDVLTLMERSETETKDYPDIFF